MSATRKAFTAIVLFALACLVIYAAKSEDSYSWLKAMHIIAVMSWMAGLLYLPRLFIYHFEAPKGSKQAETFSLMERRLINAIMRPAMALSWILGLYLAWSAYGFQGGWLHAKLAMVLCLTGANEYFGVCSKRFARGDYVKTPRFWRLMNEVPTVLMVVIVILVVVKPF